MRLLIILCLFLPVICFGQTQFKLKNDIHVVENGVTLRNAWAGGINFPWFSSIELNGDTLPDLFFFDHHNNRVLTFTNNGNPNRDLAWDYAPEFASQFPAVYKFAFLFDYDCDGKPDFFTQSTAVQCTGGITAFKNITSTPGIMQWTRIDSCMQEDFMGSPQTIFTDGVSLPHFNDIDSDGDMDILGYNTFPNGRIVYHKNLSMENFGVCDSLDFKFETGCYGNFSLNIGGTNTVGAFHSPCRTGRFDTNEDSTIATETVSYDQSEAARRDDTISSLFSLDLDGDGAQELLVGDIASSNTLMIHNDGIEMDSQDTLFPSYDNPAFYNGFHYHAFFDTDNDGFKDLVVSPYYNENKKGIWVYKNVGTNSSPLFEFRSDEFLQNTMVDGGEDASPVFFDYDADNLQDIVMNKTIFDESSGTFKTGLYLYKNTGTSVLPSYELITTDYMNLTSAGYKSPLYPAFGDLDADGDKDIVMGLEDGKFHYFQNTAGPGATAAFAAPVANYQGIDIGKYSTPQLFDLDKDGLLDILTGTQRGTVVYFRNTGSTSSPVFSSTPTNDTLGCIVLQPSSGIVDGYSVPFFYDSAGQTRLLVACGQGNIFMYNNIDGNLGGCFNQTGKVYQNAESSRVRFNITVNGADINGDTLMDIVVGQSTGGMEIRYQANPVIGISEETFIRPTFEIFPNPSDRFIDIHFYNFNGSSDIRLYSSVGQLLLNDRTNEKLFRISSGNLPQGIYFIQVISGKYSFTRKVIVRH